MAYCLPHTVIVGNHFHLQSLKFIYIHYRQRFIMKFITSRSLSEIRGRLFYTQPKGKCHKMQIIWIFLPHY